MELFFRKSGTGDPFIVLHGLYGSSDNWYSVGHELARTFTVYLIDQRNHGNSPHHPEHTYPVLAEDIREFMQAHHIDRSIILGHSMGGKTALAFGLRYPERVTGMIVVDSSPLGYGDLPDSPERIVHERIIHALKSINPETLSSRGEADKLLQQTIAPPAIRQFLLKNLKRDRNGKFYWALNITALEENLPAIFAGVIPDNCGNSGYDSRFPLLFIKGEYSGYIRSRDEAAIRQCFPGASLELIKGAGHWLHAEQPEALLKMVMAFVRS